MTKINGVQGRAILVVVLLVVLGTFSIINEPSFNGNFLTGAAVGISNGTENQTTVPIQINESNTSTENPAPEPFIINDSILDNIIDINQTNDTAPIFEVNDSIVNDTPETPVPELNESDEPEETVVNPVEPTPDMIENSTNSTSDGIMGLVVREINDSNETVSSEWVVNQELSIQADCFDSGVDPIPICSCKDLNRTREDLTVNYSLSNNVNCTNTSSWNAGVGWLPVGTSSGRFTGNFDGQGFNITELHVNRPSTNDVGLFGNVGSGGFIRNLSIYGCNVTGLNNVGCAAGYLIGHVFNVHTYGNVSGTDWVGGLSGRTSGCYINFSSAHVNVVAIDDYAGGLSGDAWNCRIIRSHATGNVTGDSRVGGLIGSNSNSGSNPGDVNNSYASGDVNAGSNGGGLVGSNYATVLNSNASGNVVSSGSSIGGLIGFDQGDDINYSFATGNVTANTRAGGLIGYKEGNINYCYTTGSVYTSIGESGGIAGFFSGTMRYSYSSSNVSGGGSENGGLVAQLWTNSIINHSFATGNVSGNADTGGLVGNSAGKIDSCFATGAVKGTSDVGGLVGDSSGTVINSFFDNQTTGQTSSDGGTGKSSADLTNIATFTDTGTIGLDNPWDFANRNNDDLGLGEYWHINSTANNGLPFLIGFGIGEIVGDIYDPIVTLTNPAAGTTLTTPPTNYTFNCSVTDSSGLSNMSLYITDLFNSTFTLNETFVINGTSNTTNKTLELIDGNYTWNCQAYDANGRGGWGINRTITSDTEGPTFTTIANQTLEYGVSLSYDIDATDPSGLSCFASNDSTNFNVSCDGILINKTPLNLQLYSLNITVNDTVNFTTYGFLWVNITDTISPAISIVYPSNLTNTTNTGLNVNFTYFDLNEGSCWYTNDSMTTNITLANCGANLTSIIWSETQHNVTIWANDTSGNENSSTITFTVDLTSPTFTTFASQSIGQSASLSYDIDATDVSGVSCFAVNDTNFQIDCDGVLQNNTLLSVRNYRLNVSVNDTINNTNSGLIWVNVTSTSKVGLTLVSPTSDTNVTFNETFTIQATVSCIDVDCGVINVSLDPVDGSDKVCNIDGSASSTGVDCNAGTCFKNEDATDGTTDSCADAAQTTHMSVHNVYLDSTSVEAGDMINITCEIWCYSSSTRVAVAYNNGSGWVNKYTGSCSISGTGASACNDATSRLRNTSVNFTVDNVIGQHSVRCMEQWSTAFTSSSTCTTASYGDNDDLNFSVIEAGKNGLVSTNSTATPFYTTTTNPYNVSLNAGESETITFTVNATGATNTTYEFFVYANMTSDMSVSNQTIKWNVTIVNFSVASAPKITITYPNANSFYSASVSAINYTLTNSSALGACKYSTDDGITNSTSVSPYVNFTGATSVEGSNTWTVYCNDTANNTGTKSSTFTVDTISPTISINSPSNDVNTGDKGLDVNFTAADANLDSCWYSNDTMLSNTSLTDCANITTVTWSLGKHNVTVWANDSTNRVVSDSINFTIVTVFPQLNFTSPTLGNATKQTTTNFKVNVSIVEADVNTVKWNWNGNNYTMYNDSLILMYNFDNVSTLGDNLTHVVDHSTNSNNGSFLNGLILNSSGRYHWGVHFDGVDDLVNLTDYYLVDGATEITASLWIRVTDLTSDETILAKDTFAPNAQILFWRDESAATSGRKDTLSILVSDGSNDARVEAAAGSLNNSGWHHVAFTFTAANATGLKLYIDGQEDANSGISTASISALESTSNDLLLGSAKNLGNPFNGSLDELKIWNRTLTAQEIYQQYASNLNRFNTTQWYLYVNQSMNATTVLTDGNYTYSTSSKDIDGNENYTDVRSLLVDSTLPAITIAFPANGTTYNNNQLNVNFTVTDTNLDSCWYNDNNGTNSTVENCANLTTETWSDGQHNITIWVNDTFANRNSAHVSFIVDTTPPLVNYTFPTPRNAITINVTSTIINVSITESSLAEIIYNWNGTNYSRYNDSLILMYNFDNISSIGANNTYVVDLSKYRNNGTFTGATKYNCTTVKYGCAAEFASNDFINSSNAGSLDLGDSFSLSAWVYVSSHDPDYSFIIAKDGPSGGSYDLGFKNSKPYVAINDGAWGEYVTDTALPTGEWHHLVGVRNSSDDLVIYVDGRINKTFSSVKSPQAVTTPLYIGRRASTDYEFVGLIDEVRIWNSSFTSAEIYQQYASNLYKLNVTQWYIYVNQSKNATATLSDGVFTYKASAKDVLGNENGSETRTITIDTIIPLITINSPFNGTNTTNTGLDVNFTALDLNKESCWYTNGTMTTNTTLVSCTNLTTIIWSVGQHNVTIWINDSAGNENSSSTTFTIQADTDNDGLADISDPILHNESNVTSTGITRLNITIGGNRTNGTFSGEQEILFFDATTLLINFTHNLSSSSLDLSNVTIIKDPTYLLVNFSGQLQGNKTLYFTDNDFVSLCVKDDEIAAITEVTSGCTGANETDLTACLGGSLNNNGLNCTDLGEIIKVENLQFSAIRGTQAAASAATTSSSSGGGGSARGSGGGGILPTKHSAPGCSSNSDCPADKTCYYGQCVKLFDVKILDFPSPISSNEFLDFTYFIKGMANISGDVVIDFWLEREGEIVSSGIDTIYLGSFEEKTESTKIFIPDNLTSGTYDFYVKVTYENYQALSHRTVSLQKSDDGLLATEISEVEIHRPGMSPGMIVFLIIMGMITFVLGALIYLRYYEIKEKAKILRLKLRFRKNFEKGKVKKVVSREQSRKSKIKIMGLSLQEEGDKLIKRLVKIIRKPRELAAELDIKPPKLKAVKKRSRRKSKKDLGLSLKEESDKLVKKLVKIIRKPKESVPELQIEPIPEPTVAKKLTKRKKPKMDDGRKLIKGLLKAVLSKPMKVKEESEEAKPIKKTVKKREKRKSSQEIEPENYCKINNSPPLP